MTFKYAVLVTVFLLTLGTADAQEINASLKADIQRVLNLHESGQKTRAIISAKLALESREGSSAYKREEVVLCMSLLAWLLQDHGQVNEL